MATLVASGGTTDIPDAVLEKIGELALKDVHGISSQSNPTASAFGRIRDLVNKHSENNPTTVNVSSGDNALTVDIQLSVAVPHKPYAVAMEAGTSVLEAIEYTTGLPVTAVDVHVFSATSACDSEIYTPKHGSQVEAGQGSSRVNITYSQQVLDYCTSHTVATMLDVAASDVKVKISDSSDAVSATVNTPVAHALISDFARTRGTQAQALEQSLSKYAESVRTPLTFALRQNFGRATNTVELKISTISGESGGTLNPTA
ncbi:Asp23/Gls24 family envelope stress response protein [Rothia terrae]|uniref:Asp23/Gls24 family envelope stress response protein n=1 Tax=Rothia terrae TaxID=396015 RepID=A0A7H2BDX3_9MICC|nr:Asp23/Gls24 family envelope stress response protein [Rothia terrae]QNV37869.1 Asp23/Gls24 family envelope stress response protein [Rothia terrae]